MFGLGGVFTEVLKDVSFRRAPVSPQTARGMIIETERRCIAQRARGAEPCDLDRSAMPCFEAIRMAAAHSEAIEALK